MADPISLASGLVALVAFAGKSSLTLYKTVNSFQSYQRTFRELKEETEALSGVLDSLGETVANDAELDLPALKLPLMRCGKACKEFEEKIAKCTRRSNGDKASWRDWAKLTYLGEDITQFRNMLAGYKATIGIALADANLRKTAVTPTPELLDKYRTMILEARADLRDHLQIIDDNLRENSDSASASEEEEAERRQIEEERSSAVQCLNICARLSTHIDEIQPVPAGPTGGTRPPERITTNTLQKCKDSLSDAATQLDKHRQRLDARLEMKSRGSSHPDNDGVDVEELRKQRESITQCIEICTKASEQEAAERINIMEDFDAASDSCTIFASTIGELVWAKRVSIGENAISMFGQTNDDTIQHVVGHHYNRLGPLPIEQQNRYTSEFRDRFGPGYKLSQPTPDKKV